MILSHRHIRATVASRACRVYGVDCSAFRRGNGRPRKAPRSLSPARAAPAERIALCGDRRVAVRREHAASIPKTYRARRIIAGPARTCVRGRPDRSLITPWFSAGSGLRAMPGAAVRPWISLAWHAGTASAWLPRCCRRSRRRDTRCSQPAAHRRPPYERPVRGGTGRQGR